MRTRLRNSRSSLVPQFILSLPYQHMWSMTFIYQNFTLLSLLLGRVTLGAQRPIVIKLSRVRSVGRSVCPSVCPVHCGKTADRSRQPFGTIRRTGPRMRQVLGFGNRSTGRGTFGGEFGPHHCNQWGLYGVRVRQCLNRRSCGFGWCLRWAEALLY